jgi:hypothetical protein
MEAKQSQKEEFLVLIHFLTVFESFRTGFIIIIIIIIMIIIMIYYHDDYHDYRHFLVVHHLFFRRVGLTSTKCVL